MAINSIKVPNEVVGENIVHNEMADTVWDFLGHSLIIEDEVLHNF